MQVIQRRRWNPVVHGLHIRATEAKWGAETHVYLVTSTSAYQPIELVDKIEPGLQAAMGLPVMARSVQRFRRETKSLGAACDARDLKKNLGPTVRLCLKIPRTKARVRLSSKHDQLQNPQTIPPPLNL